VYQYRREAWQPAKARASLRWVAVLAIAELEGTTALVVYRGSAAAVTGASGLE
jgi:hypothetical protein